MSSQSMPRQSINLSTPRSRRRTALPLAMFAAAVFAVLSAPAANASSKSSAELELKLSIPSGAITNKFGFATSFPRPENAPAIGDKNGNPGGERATFTANGGTASLGPNPATLGIARLGVAKGRGMGLRVEGATDAAPVDGSIGQAEGWLSGVTKFRLGNFTGREGLPAAETISVDLSMEMFHDLRAAATNDVVIADLANAKVVYSLTNVDTGDVLVPETVVAVDDDDAKPDAFSVARMGIPTPAVTIPANTFYNLELFGHVYVADESRGSAPPNPPADPPAAAIPNLKDRMNQPLPDDDMRMPISVTALFGDAFGNGDWLLASLAGVTGEDPLAQNGFDTVMAGQFVNSGDSFFDIAYEIEVPFNDSSQIALEDTMMAAAGMHGFFLDMQVGTGVGDQFQLSQDPGALSIFGPQSELPPQEQTGAYKLLEANDPLNPTQMLFEGQLNPGQLAQFQLLANVHDQVDGVLDGMARFTLRKYLEGFAGDYTGDLLTNDQDLALWQQLYGTNDFLADGDGNGLIGGGDFLHWQRNHGRGFGSTGGPALLTGAIPEPTSMTLTLMGFALLGRAARRRMAT